MVDYFDAAIFFDNDHSYITDVIELCPLIDVVKVYEDPDPPLSSLTEGYLKSFIDSYPNNTYIQYLLKNNYVPQYSPYSGITAKDIEYYKTWERNSTGNRILLLDWDLTLSKFSDMHVPKEDVPMADLLEKEGITSRDMAVFYLGGEYRFHMIKNWLEEVAKKKIRIGIITNNGACKKQIFSAIVGEVAPKDSFELICSRFAPSNANKGKALSADPRFTWLCKKNGRLRNTRRGRKHHNRSRSQSQTTKNRSRKRNNLNYRLYLVK